MFSCSGCRDSRIARVAAETARLVTLPSCIDAAQWAKTLPHHGRALAKAAMIRAFEKGPTYRAPVSKQETDACLSIAGAWCASVPKETPAARSRFLLFKAPHLLTVCWSFVGGRQAFPAILLLLPLMSSAMRIGLCGICLPAPGHIHHCPP